MYSNPKKEKFTRLYKAKAVSQLLLTVTKGGRLSLSFLDQCLKMSVLSMRGRLSELRVQSRLNSLTKVFFKKNKMDKITLQTTQLLDIPRHLALESISDQMSWLTDFRGSAIYKLTTVLRKFGNNLWDEFCFLVSWGHVKLKDDLIQRGFFF